MRKLATLLLAGLAAVAAADDFGPLETRNLRSLSVPFLRIDPRPSVLGAGERTLSAGLTAANDIRKMYQGGALKIDEDYEVDRLLLRYRMGLGKGFDATFDLPLLSRGGGILDPFIDAYHKIVLGGVQGNVRNGVPYGQSHVIIPGSGPYGSEAGIGDVSAWITKQLAPRWMATLAAKLPTGKASGLLGSGNVDGALAVQYDAPLGTRWSFFGQAGVVAQGRTTELQGTRGLVHQEALGFGWQPNSRDHWVIQWQGEASAIQTGVPGSDSTHRMLSVGFQRKLSDRRMLELFFSEDGDWLNYRVPELVNIAPDFTCGLRFVSRF